MKVTGIMIGGMLTLALALHMPAFAQQAGDTRLFTGGLMSGRDNVSPSDLFELSQTQFNFGTARSMSMAGAFTSLGADLSSMSINPAGLGMFRRNEISITPMMTFASAENSAAAYEKNSKNRFSIGNFGALFNAYEGSGALVSLNIGIGYNRLADLNYRSSFAQTGNIGSIADMYSKQLDYANIKAVSIMGNNLEWGNVPSGLWPAVLGYKCGLTDDPTNEAKWSPTWISSNRYDPETGQNNIDIGQYSTVESRGSVGEYAVSLGANISNKIYVGATLGIRTIYQKKTYYYKEDYTYPTPGSINEGYAPDLDYQLLHSQLNQAVIVDGTGVDFKLGVTYRPTDNLRIGAAFHTPTYYWFTRDYQAAMASNTYANRHTNPDIKPDKKGFIPLEASTPVLRDSGPDSWSFISPSRMLLGVSYTFGQRGVIAVDYERSWYNGIRVKDAPNGVELDMYDNTFRNQFKGSNTLRVGVEFKPVPIVALRAGFGYSGSWLKDDDTNLDVPIAKQITYYSAGVGFMLSRGVSLDVAYSYQLNKQTAYNLYYADEYEYYRGDWELIGVNASDLFSTDIKRHSVAMTLSFRF